MRLRVFALSLALGLIVLSGLGAAAQTFTTGVDVANSLQTWFYAVNDNGDMVGAYMNQQGKVYGLLRVGNTDLKIDVGPDAAWVQAWDLTNPDSNGRITVVGQYGTGQNIKGFAAEYDPGTGAFTYTLLNAVIRTYTMPFGISDSGLIVGCMHSAGAADMGPWLLLGGTFLLSHDLSSMYTDMNNRGDIAGFRFDPNMASGSSFIIQGQHVHSFSAFNAAHTRTYGLNDAGDAVGFYFGDPGHPGYHGFLRTAGGAVIAIDVQGATRTFAYGINSEGVVVGAYRDSQGRHHGFRRDP